MEAGTQCAYNHTRECFLGLEIAPADLSPSKLAEKLKGLALKSGEGLWIQPFREMPPVEMPAPLDLIYLDEEDQVLDMVESFPTFRSSSSLPKASSVLALPAHSIYSSQTQMGDQLVVCIAEEMEYRLEVLSRKQSAGFHVQSAVLLREQPLWSGGPGTLELESTSHEMRTRAGVHEIGLVKPNGEPQPPSKWLERWWFPDPRKAPREAAPGLAAYYWNGGAPEAHGIRDISSSGIYVVTEERWYPGTLVLMVLQRTDCGEEVAERSIAVQTRAVRWGHDGVGLQFVLADARDLKKFRGDLSEGAKKKELDRFLDKLKK